MGNVFLKGLEFFVQKGYEPCNYYYVKFNFIKNLSLNSQSYSSLSIVSIVKLVFDILKNKPDGYSFIIHDHLPLP